MSLGGGVDVILSKYCEGSVNVRISLLSPPGCEDHMYVCTSKYVQMWVTNYWYVPCIGIQAGRRHEVDGV